MRVLRGKKGRREKVGGRNELTQSMSSMRTSLPGPVDPGGSAG